MYAAGKSWCKPCDKKFCWRTQEKLTKRTPTYYFPRTSVKEFVSLACVRTYVREVRHLSHAAYLWDCLLSFLLLNVCILVSALTSLHNRVSNWAVILRSLLWRFFTKPPFLQDKLCCKSYLAPQLHTDDNRDKRHRYLIFLRSQNLCFVSNYFSSLSSNGDSHADAPWCWLISFNLTLSAGQSKIISNKLVAYNWRFLFFIWFLIFSMSLLARKCCFVFHVTFQCLIDRLSLFGTDYLISHNIYCMKIILLSPK